MFCLVCQDLQSQLRCRWQNSWNAGWQFISVPLCTEFILWEISMGLQCLAAALLRSLHDRVNAALWGNDIGNMLWCPQEQACRRLHDNGLCAQIYCFSFSGLRFDADFALPSVTLAEIEHTWPAAWVAFEAGIDVFKALSKASCVHCKLVTGLFHTSRELRSSSISVRSSYKNSTFELEYMGWEDGKKVKILPATFGSQDGLNKDGDDSKQCLPDAVCAPPVLPPNIVCCLLAMRSCMCYFWENFDFMLCVTLNTYVLNDAPCIGSLPPYRDCEENLHARTITAQAIRNMTALQSFSCSKWLWSHFWECTAATAAITLGMCKAVLLMCGQSLKTKFMRYLFAVCNRCIVCCMLTTLSATDGACTTSPISGSMSADVPFGSLASLAGPNSDPDPVKTSPCIFNCLA